MPVGDVHIAGPGGWALCGASGPLNGYNATSRACTDCEDLDWKARQGQAHAERGEPPSWSFRILGGSNGWGLSRDADIVARAFFDAGYKQTEGPAQVFVHLERVEPHMLGFAKRHVVIPNPEWWCPVGNVSTGLLNKTLRDRSVVVWAKTKDAERIFTALGAQVTYIGFRSHDRRSSFGWQGDRSFLHVAGVGPNKRTDHLLSIWRSEWPRLTVTSSVGSSRESGNVRVIVQKLSDEELCALQNKHLFHIYPSRYEGFGHAQWEALSCGSIVFVNSGPPFDEHPGAFRLLESDVYGGPEWNPMVSWRDVKIDALEQAIEWAMRLPSDSVGAYRTAARRAWEVNQIEFHRRIQVAIAGLVP